jgi:hypothetical protein
MLISVVVDPNAFNRALFSTPGYRDQAEVLFRGLESNGLMLVDSQSKLLDELDEQLKKLSTKDGQQLQIRFAELRKRPGYRFITVDASRCDTQHCSGFHHVACTVRARCFGDSVILDEPTFEEFQSRKLPCDSLIPLSRYISSGLELERRRFMEQLPFIDQMQPGEFDDLISRSVRFSKTLQFFDKQIGHGSSLGRFRAGIERILRLWTVNCHFAKPTLRAELFTCVQDTHEPEQVVHRRVLEGITQPLSREFGVPFTLFWKQDSPRISHDRYLVSDNISLYFTKGFDFVDGGSLQRCKIQIDNGAALHLAEYRKLKDSRPPA